MRHLRAFFMRILGVFTRKGREGDVAAERDSQLQLHIEDNLRAGMTPEEARRQALVAPGGLGQTMESVRETRGTFLDSIRQDAVFALRLMRRSPAVTTMAVLSLALGIGANTAFFSLADAVLFRPFPIKSPERLVVLYTTTKADSKLERTSYPDYLEYRRLTTVFAGVSAFGRYEFPVNSGRWTERIECEIVSGNYFDVLGTNMPLGRGFLPDEDREFGGHPAAVISYGFWQRNLGSDPAAVGRKILIQGTPIVVVGVAPRTFRGMALDRESPPEIWISMALMAKSWLQLRDNRWLDVIGRLKPGVALEQAAAAARLRAALLENTFAKTNGGRTVTIVPQADARFWPARRKPVVSVLTFMLASSGIVLLIACINVATLLLAQVHARSQEIAIRTALGAGRSRVARQFLTEGFLLTAAGLGFGLMVAEWVFSLLARYPQMLSIPMTLDLSVDLRAFRVAALVSVIPAAVLGLFPALQALRTDLAGALQRRTRPGGSSPYGFRVRGALVAVQVALSLVLLAGAGLFVRTVRNAKSLDTGYRGENVLVLWVDFALMSHRYDDTQGMQILRQLLPRIQNLPGVRSATLSGDVPLTTRRLLLRFVKEDRGPVRETDWIQVDANIVGPRYFETLGIPIIRGRDFAESDDESAPEGAIIISQSMASQYWPGENPVGKTLRIRSRVAGSREVYRIVGVSKNLRQRSLWEEAGPYVYLPFYQRYFSQMMLMVKTEGSAAAFLPAVVGEIHTFDSDMPVYGTGLLSDQVEQAIAPQRMAAAFLSASGFLALILAAVGVYGVTSYVVVRRGHEISIRMALGADRRTILRVLLQDTMMTVGIGLAVGLPAALALSRTVSSLLYGVSPSDPATFAVIVIVLAGVSLLACYVPARRACLAEPLAGLHRE